MENAKRPALEVINELAVVLEARQINRLHLRRALDRGTFTAWPELEPLGEHLRSRLKDCGDAEAGAEFETAPDGLSIAAEVLWRCCHLKRLGCPRGDIEGILAMFGRATGIEFTSLVATVFESEEGILRVRI